MRVYIELTIIEFCKNKFGQQEITEDEVKEAEEILIRGMKEAEHDEMQARENSKKFIYFEGVNI